MKIGIDASRAFADKKTGIEEYSYQLIRNMANANFSFCQFVLFVRKDCKVDIKLPDNFKIKVINNNLFWTKIGLSSELKKNPIDVLFIPSYSVPFIHPKKTVVTIHGLEFKNCPSCYSFKDRLVLELNTLISILFASKIIVPSKSTKDDLAKFYKVDPRKIKVVYHGIENGKRKTENGKQKDAFNILFIGRIEKRKNPVNLVRAFEIFMNRIGKDERGGIKLILAGKEGFGFKDVADEINKNFYKKNIMIAGFVSEEEKENLYKNADLFVFPSFCEGFGMPVLEAMSYGVPVVCSCIPPLIEVANKSAVFFNPKSAINIANVIKAVFDDKNFREALILKGLKNAKRFNWEKCAEKTLQMLVK